MSESFYQLSLALCICFMANAQSVMGIPFGASIDAVIVDLEDRGYQFKKSENSLMVVNVILNDEKFLAAFLNFQKDKEGYTYFNEAYFVKEFDNKKDADRERDRLARKLSKKYPQRLESPITVDGRLTYLLGTKLNSDGNVVPQIFICTRKSNHEGYYGVYVNYYPEDFVDELSDF